MYAFCLFSILLSSHMNVNVIRGLSCLTSKRSKPLTVNTHFPKFTNCNVAEGRRKKIEIQLSLTRWNLHFQ